MVLRVTWKELYSITLVFSLVITVWAVLAANRIDEGAFDLVTVGIGCAPVGYLPIESTRVLLGIVQEDVNRHCVERGLPYRFEYVCDLEGGQWEWDLAMVQRFKSWGIDLVACNPGAFTTSAYEYVLKNDMLLVGPASISVPSVYTGTSLFGICLDDTSQAPTIAETLWSLGIENCIVVGRDDAWADGLYLAFSSEYSERGGEVAGRITYQPDEANFSSHLEAAEILAREAVENHGESHVGVLLLSLGEASRLALKATDYSTVYDLLWFGSDATALGTEIVEVAPREADHLKILSPYANPTGLPGYVGLSEEWATLTDAPLGLYSTVYHDACWLLALSVISSGSTDTFDVKHALPHVAEYYYGPDVLDSVGEDHAVLKLDYDIWGYGLVEGVCQGIRYGEYDGSTGRVTWFDTAETFEGVETPGLGTP